LKSYKLKLRPLQVFEALSKKERCFFLDSSLRGRYSFLGIEPYLVLETKGQNPFGALRRNLEQYKNTPIKGAPPFLGGAVGYLAYDLGFILEDKLKNRQPKAGPGIPDCAFGFYNKVVIIDHLKSLLYIACSGAPEKRGHLSGVLARENLRRVENIIKGIGSCFAPCQKTKHISGSGSFESNFTKNEYINAIKRAKEYIRQGDIYQVNLSQRFETKSNLPGVEIYRRLRNRSPACFNAYLSGGGFEILSSSPERFLALEGRKVITQPMKGTRPRGKDKKQDSVLKSELKNSVKDKAELMMIVDLERNDLGKVCSYESIKVTNLREIEIYSTVFQTTATIEGELFVDKDRVDLLQACFPGGSITGCPKIRAMEIIDELEPDRRSIYTGALGYLSFSGEMDFNILIRTILKKNNAVYFGAGGGIVADSSPEEEYRETLVKAQGMLSALGIDRPRGG